MKPGRELARDAWETFLLYLPLACLGLLAMGSYWMVHSTPKADIPVAPALHQHAPDYFMEKFSIKTFDASGHLRSEVLGDSARHFPDTQWIEIDGIRIRSFDEKGRLTTASALRGLANEDGSQVQLIGKAVVVREGGSDSRGESIPRMQYRGEFLHAFLTTEQIRSNQPVEIVRGNDRFTADRLEFDNVAATVSLQGRVRGTISTSPTPKPAKSP